MTVASGCASFKPTPIDQIPFKERIQTQERDGMRVSVSVLSRDEARQVFDVKLEERGIQPVWLKIENNTDKAFWFMMTGLDPNYFSAHEAAYMNHYFWGGKDNREMDEYFDSLAINPLIPSGGTSEGFAFSNLRIGTKAVRVRLFGDRDVRDFEYFVEVPGFEVAWDQEAIFRTYTEDQLVHFTDEQEFLDAVAALPCCTSRSDGAPSRDPLNIVIVSTDGLQPGLVKAGWDAADSFLWESTRNYFGGLKYDGRPPDVGLQKVRDTTHATIAVVLWLTNLRFNGNRVWIGSISRDVDPDVDGARTYLGEDFLIARVVDAIGFTTGVGVVSPVNPRKTAANMDYHTDGDRLVMGLSRQPTRFEDIDFYGIEERRARKRQRQSSTNSAPRDQTVKPPQALDEIPFMERSQTQERDGLRITVAALSEDEARSAFGVNLKKKRIQPVWIDIENSTDEQLHLMLNSIDPRYYSAMEAAYLFHKAGNPTRNEQLDQYFESQKLDPEVLARSRNSGFVYANLKRGTREVRIRLLAEGRIEYFEFYVAVPGLKADWERVDFGSIYRRDEFVNYDDDEAFAEALRALPCCTTKKDGTGSGDPINLVVIGEAGYILDSFIAAGWDETEIVTAGTSWKTFKSFFGAEYKYSPISALYIYLRPQDAGLQKARDTINERNHLRLWLAPMTYNGKLVFVGGMSRDIGVRMTTKAWNLTTHEIDSDIDEARNYLTEDLATAGRIATFGLIDGVGYTTRDDPKHNLLGSPWWTDGRRMVMELSSTPVALDAMETFSFHVPLVAPASETPIVRGQTEASGPDGKP